MSSRNRRWAGGSLTSLAALIFVAALSATPSVAGGDDGRTRSCYPGNEYVYSPGSAQVESSGEGKFTESELEYGFLNDTNHGGGDVEWDLAGKVVQRNNNNRMSGDLELKVEFDNGDKVTFKSRCVAEVQSTYEEESHHDGGIELEAEGTVKGFPADPNGGGNVSTLSGNGRGQDAVVMARITPDGKVAFSIELGSTCFEGYPFNETELGFNTENTDMDLDAPNRDVGRWGFPNGYGPSNCDGAG
jgi:hypothetical protein